MQDTGYYYAIWSDITIECYDPPSGANSQGNVSYIYTSDAATNNTVEITNNATVLTNLQDTGLNMTAGTPTSTSSGAASTGSDSIPNSDGGSGAQSNGGSGTSSGSGSSTTGFSQGGSSTSTATTAVNERVFQSSLFAVLVAVVALVVL